MDVLGSLAAALQLADAGFRSLFKVYAVVKDIKEFPKQFRDVFHDLEISQNLLTELQQEASRPQSRLSGTPNQSQRLITILEGIASCSQSLSARLNKALPASNGSRVRRVWRALALLAREDDVLRECDRLQSLKQDLHIELQNIGVTLINVANTSLENIKAKLEQSPLYALNVTPDIFDSKSMMTNSPLPPAQDLGPVVARLSGIEDSNMRIEEVARSLHKMLISKSASTPPPVLSSFSSEDREQAAIRCCIQLAQYPADLKTADCMLNRQSRCHDIRETYTSWEAVTLCSCGEKRATSTRCFGPIKVEYMSKIAHEPSCKVFTKIREERKTTIKFSIRPFVNQTIELVLRSSYGTGGPFNSRNIKFHRIVSRRLSPAFQKFESFNCLPLESSYKIFRDLVTLRDSNTPFSIGTPTVAQYELPYDQSLLCHYSDDIILAWLDGLPKTLEEIFQSGDAHPADRDEFGNTLIHELIFTWYYLGKRSSTFGDSIRRIATYLYNCGVDFNATTSMIRAAKPRGDDQRFTFYDSSFHNASVADLAYYALFAQSNADGWTHTTQERMPLPIRLVSELDLHVDDSFLNRFTESREEMLCRKSHLLDLLFSASTAMGIIYDLELNPLHFAVLQRSMDRVLQYSNKFPPPDETRQSEYTFNIVECAIGWQCGLVTLAEAGYQIDGALRLTIFRKDLGSLQTLLSSKSYLPNSSLKFTLGLNCETKSHCTHKGHHFTSTHYHSSFKQEVMKHFVNAIKSRRERLLNLALSKLSETAVRSLNLDSSRLLDTDAPTIADMLRKDGIKLPVCLIPDKTPVFHSFRISCVHGGIQLANILYETGFTEVDAPDDEGMTPLQRLVERSTCVRPSGPEALAIRWLVEHGADVNKSFGRNRLPLIFVITSTYSSYKISPWHEYDFIWWRWSSDNSLHQLRLEDSTGSGKRCSLGMHSTLITDPAIYFADGSDSGDERGEPKPSGCDHGHDDSNDSDNSDNDRNEESSDSGEAELNQRGDHLSTVAKHSNIINDSCECHCSTKGCLPIHKLPLLRRGSVKTWKQIQDDLFSWIEECDSLESQAGLYVEAACRLELFERLGMAHTCCERTPLSQGLPRSSAGDKLAEMSQETRRELQAEDATSKEQLDLIMDAFKRAMKSRAAWPLWEFWQWWWKIVDVMLPPLLPWERGLQYCRPKSSIPRSLMSRLLDISANRSQRLLEMAGYKDMSFMDIIHKHLAEFLSDHQQETTHIRLPESSSYSHRNRVHGISPRKAEVSRPRKSKARSTEALRGRKLTITCCCFKGRLCE